MWLISPKLRQPSFNLVSFSCKIEADKPRRWALVWISGSTQEFNVIQSLPSKLTPISLQVFVQAEPRSGSWLSWLREAGLTQPSIQSFEPAKKPTILAQLFTQLTGYSQRRGQTRPPPLPSHTAANFGSCLLQRFPQKLRKLLPPWDNIVSRGPSLPVGCLAHHWALGVPRGQLGGGLKRCPSLARMRPASAMRAPSRLSWSSQGYWRCGAGGG